MTHYNVNYIKLSQQLLLEGMIYIVPQRWMKPNLANVLRNFLKNLTDNRKRNQARRRLREEYEFNNKQANY